VKLRQLIALRDDFVLKIVDIRSDKRLLDRYALEIPVVVLEGRTILRASEINSPSDIESKLVIGIDAFT